MKELTRKLQAANMAEYLRIVFEVIDESEILTPYDAGRIIEEMQRSPAVSLPPVHEETDKRSR